MLYSIVHLTPATNVQVGRHASATHAVSLSGGLASALAAERAIRRYGRDHVLLWFADTQEEDDDLYRFLRDLMCRWGGTLYWFTDGRRPLDVAEAKRIIPCNQLAPCSFELKVRPYREFICAMPTVPVVIIGLAHWETLRLQKTRESYAKALPQVTVEYPLLWEPLETRPLMEVCLHDWEIAPPRLYTLGFPHNNCFAGETCYVTGDGIKSLAETVGQTVEVLSDNGAYASAEIRSFGVQPLFALTVERYGQKKTIYTTQEHRWICYAGERSNQRKEKLTRELKPGDRLVPMFGGYMSGVRPSAFGIAHGITFGDGTCNTSPNSFAHVVLCGDKDRELLRYFPLSPTVEMPNVGIRVNDLPRYFKDLPSLNESKSYLYGWLAGYFAADGKVAVDGLCALSSATKEHLEDTCSYEW